MGTVRGLFMAEAKRRTGTAVAALLAVGLFASALPTATGLPTDGLWIVPHVHIDAAVAGGTDSSYYVGDNDSAVLADSFYADSGPDAANLQVDLYNPSGGTLPNVQLFAALSDVTLWTSISFSGGESGDVTYDTTDSLSAGTPSGLDAHDVYPAYFASYGVGDVGAGASSTTTVWVNVSGDFSGGLIVHLDFVSTDASGTTVSGPFEADMNIFEAAEAGACAAATADYASGPAEGAGYWKQEYDKTVQGRGHTDYTADDLTALLQGVAANSDFFTYATWGGTTPSGDSDCGSKDIDSFAEAVSVLGSHGHASTMVERVERAALALWLNVASGKVDLDGELQVNEAATDGNTTTFAQETGLSAPGADYDTAREVLAFAEGVLLEASNASASDLALAKALCESVNEGWLVPA